MVYYNVSHLFPAVTVEQYVELFKCRQVVVVGFFFFCAEDYRLCYQAKRKLNNV
jgi:hypothetical protein